MSQVSASEHGPVCSRRGYADRGPATLFNIYTCMYEQRARARTRDTKFSEKERRKVTNFLSCSGIECAPCLAIISRKSALSDYFIEKKVSAEVRVQYDLDLFQLRFKFQLNSN